MTLDEKRQWRRRAQRVLNAPIPSSVRNGSANRAIQYREDAAMVAAFVRGGAAQSLERVPMAVLRMEGIQ
jgi:hypothetical protein